MENTYIYTEIKNIKNHRKRAYFLWKNKIKLLKDYGAMTENEFVEHASKLHLNPITDRNTFFYHMQRWESTPEYKRLMFLLKEDQFASDLLEVYDKSKKSKTRRFSEYQEYDCLTKGNKNIVNHDEFQEKLEQEEAEEEKDDGLII